MSSRTSSDGGLEKGVAGEMGEAGRRPRGGPAQPAEAVALSPEPFVLLEPPESLELLEPPESLELLELLESPEPPDGSDPEPLDELVSAEPDSDFFVEPASAFRPLATEPWSFL